MSKQKKSEAEGKRRGLWRPLLAVVLVVGAGYLVWATVAPYRQGLPPKEGAETQWAGGPGRGGAGGDGERPASPTAEERQARFAEFADELKLSDEQRARMQALMAHPPERGEGREGWEARRQAFEEILTPEQQEQARQIFRQRMAQGMERMRQVLSEEDFAALQRRIEERMERGGPGGPGGGRGQ